MKLKNWMTGKAIVCALFALIFFLDPLGAADMYGMQVGDAGAYLSRLLGASFVVLTIFLWLMRGVESPRNRRAICMAVCVGDLAGAVAALMAQLSGVTNTVGWTTVVLYLVLALGFGYFLLPR